VGKVVLQMQLSADGYVGRPGGGPEWQVWDWGEKCSWDAALISKFNAFFDEVDCILLSRKLLEGGYLDHWTEFARRFSHRPEFAFAERIVQAHKVVFSHKLKETKWSGTNLARRTLAEEVDDLKAQSGGTIVAFGGAGFGSSLIAADLIDEFQFYVNPIALGKGLSIFTQRGIDADLELLSGEPFKCGIVVCRYAPRGRSPTAENGAASTPDEAFVLAQTLSAPPQAIFDAWTQPELMKQWMFVGPSNEIYKVQADVRVGGAFSILEWTGAEHIDHFGHFTEVSAPHRLAFSLRVPKHFPGRTLVRVQITVDPVGASVILRQSGVDPRVVEKPWRAMFDALAKLVGDLRSAAERHVGTPA
jgi:uncharacterized protein YndB with AHSA1/START domain/dihydrofolate reductase